MLYTGRGLGLYISWTVHEPGGQNKAEPKAKCHKAALAESQDSDYFRSHSGSFTDAIAIAVDLIHLLSSPIRSVSTAIAANTLDRADIH